MNRIRLRANNRKPTCRLEELLIDECQAADADGTLEKLSGMEDVYGWLLSKRADLCQQYPRLKPDSIRISPNREGRGPSAPMLGVWITPAVGDMSHSLYFGYDS